MFFKISFSFLFVSVCITLGMGPYEGNRLILLCFCVFATITIAYLSSEIDQLKREIVTLQTQSEKNSLKSASCWKKDWEKVAREHWEAHLDRSVARKRIGKKGRK